MSTQIPFGASSEFAVNPESRCPCILLLDTSGSMQGKPITELQAGLTTYRDELMADALAAKRVEVAVVTFGGVVHTACDFVTADNFVPPELAASGDTPLGKAVMHALDMLTKRKAQYRENGVSFYRPWVFLITDGSPTDAWDEASEKIKEGETKKAFSFFCVGVENANLEILGKIAVREPMKLQGLKFRDLFKWLSNSQQAVSRSTPGESVPLPPPRGWAEV